MDKSQARARLTTASEQYWAAEAAEKKLKRLLYQAVIDVGDALSLREMATVVKWSDEHIRQIQKTPDRYLHCG